MACPWFSPQHPVRETATGPSPRTPLGELWTGLCCAPGHFDEALSDACNSGYARGRCPSFPSDALDDAVRFHVTSENGDLIRLQYIYEREWWPAGNGVLEYSRSLHAIAPAAESDLLRRQAAAFAASWIRKTEER